VTRRRAMHFLVTRTFTVREGKGVHMKKVVNSIFSVSPTSTRAWYLNNFPSKMVRKKDHLPS
jgi:hypothetical protein